MKLSKLIGGMEQAQLPVYPKIYFGSHCQLSFDSYSNCNDSMNDNAKNMLHTEW